MAPKYAKTDNHNPTAKLALRRYFLDKYHTGQPIHVFDCCQGSGLLWDALKKEYKLASYWGVDKKQKKGRLQIDSVRVLAQPGLKANVIDVDTYGSPWKHWQQILTHLDKPVTVLLTIGQVMMGVDGYIIEKLGLANINVPPGIAGKLVGIGLKYALTDASTKAIKIVEALEVVSDGSARYIGVRLEPEQKKSPLVFTAPAGTCRPLEFPNG